MSELDAIFAVARRGLTTSLGVVVLVAQHAQVQRRELAKSAPRLLEEVGERMKTVGEKLADLDERADDIFDTVEQKLPEGLRSPAREVHDILRELRRSGQRTVGPPTALRAEVRSLRRGAGTCRCRDPRPRWR